MPGNREDRRAEYLCRCALAAGVLSISLIGEPNSMPCFVELSIKLCVGFCDGGDGSRSIPIKDRVCVCVSVYLSINRSIDRALAFLASHSHSGIVS